MPITTPIVRFSLATLFLVFAWVALLCVGLTHPSRVLSGFIACVSLFALMTAVLAAIYQSGHARAFAIGFAVFGCSYLLWLRFIEGYNPLSVSKTLGDQAFVALNKGEWDSRFVRRATNTPANALTERRDRFTATIQGAAIMLVATIGGFIGRYLSVKRADAQVPPMATL
jgi:hypothetical protein